MALFLCEDMLHCRLGEKVQKLIIACCSIKADLYITLSILFVVPREWVSREAQIRKAAVGQAVTEVFHLRKAPRITPTLVRLKQSFIKVAQAYPWMVILSLPRILCGLTHVYCVCAKIHNHILSHVAYRKKTKTYF